MAKMDNFYPISRKSSIINRFPFHNLTIVSPKLIYHQWLKPMKDKFSMTKSMELEYSRADQVIYILDNGRRIYLMAKVFLSIRMDKDMKDNSVKIKKMGKECFITKMEISLKDNGKIIVFVDMVSYKEQISIKEIGKIIYHMVKV